MASITWTDVEAHAPHLSTVAAGAQANILAHVNTFLTVSAFDGEAGAKTKLARVYLACHFGQLEANAASGAAGPVTSKRLGDMAIGYASPTASAPSTFSETGYGKAYDALARTNFIRAGMVL